MKIDKIRLKKLKNSDYLWKYLTLSKFVNLALSNSLVFSRLDKFEDPNEGITQQMLWELIEGKPSDQDLLNGNQMRNFANCWCTGNRESVAMWNLYAKDGVAIRMKKMELVKLLEEGRYRLENERHLVKMIVGMIEYKDFTDPHSLTGKGFKQKYSTLRKDVSFAHEKELRIILKYKDLSFPINSATPADLTSPKNNASFFYPSIKMTFNNPSDFRANVILNPKMSDWERENINKIITMSNLSLTSEFSELKLK